MLWSLIKLTLKCSKNIKQAQSLDIEVKNMRKKVMKKEARNICVCKNQAKQSF